MTKKQRPSASVPVIRVSNDSESRAEDLVAVEEPLELRLQWERDGEVQRKSIAVTMRTPGDDLDLAVGFLFGEGIIDGREDYVDVAHCTDEDEEQAYNIVTVTLRPGLSFDADRLERNFYTTSSCGVCGKASIEALEVSGCCALPDGMCVEANVVMRLPDALRGAQAVFDQTGGLHGAGLIGADGELVSVREDVGRHNAVDKLIGQQVQAGRVALESNILCLSGRASFELVQKALVARIPAIVAVGAPSSMAVQLASSFNMTLVGFAKAESFNVYSGQERIVSTVSPIETAAD